MITFCKSSPCSFEKLEKRVPVASEQVPVGAKHVPVRTEEVPVRTQQVLIGYECSVKRHGTLVGKRV
jgi:hypothetical protein